MQVQAAAEASGRLAAAEVALLEEQASRQAADRGDGALRIDFDRLVAAGSCWRFVLHQQNAH